MKRSRIFWLLLLSTAVSAYGQDPNMTIRVMTYNILKGAYSVDDQPPYDYDRADAIISFVNTQNPDVLLLQECNQWADSGNTRLQYFSTQLGMPYKVIAPNHKSFKVAILSKYPIADYTYLGDEVYYWWNILTAEIQLTSSCSVAVASTHFGWWGADDYSSMTEEQQADSYSAQKAVLISYLQNLVDGDLIIGGDWNHSAQQSPFGRGNLHDEIAALGYGLDLLRRFYPSENPIDNIYVSRSGRFIAQNCERKDEVYSLYLSDHLPVVADITVVFNPPPVITQQPVSQLVDVNSTAVLTLSGLNQTSYTWYKSGDSNNSTPGDDVQIGSNSSSLTLPNFGMADEGYYYCVLTNNYGSIASDIAVLSIGSRLITPARQFVEYGDTAMFSVGGLDQADYAWYKSTDPNTNTPADDVVVGGNSNSVILNNVQVSNEGYYYCVISISGVEISSEIGSLIVKRLISNWKFNNSLAEYLSGYSGTRINPAVYETGVLGNAIVFSASADDYVKILYKEKLNLKSFTFSTWAKVATGSSGTSRVLYNNRNTLSTDSSGTLLYVRGSDFWAATVRAANNVEHLIQGSEAIENQWQLVTITFEQTGVLAEDLIGVFSLYIDGRISAQISDVPYRPNTAQVDMVIGSAWTSTAGYFNPFKGVVDDVRYYSYAMNPREVAQLYVDVTGQPICVPDSEFDFNEDCIVDFEDLAEFIIDWSIGVNFSDFAEFADKWFYDSYVYP